jgi:hypothetical protein
MGEEPSVSRSAQDDQLLVPLPGPEAAAKRAQNPVPPGGSSEHSQNRKAFKAVAIGVVATIFGAIAIPLLIVVILAFVAQLIITGH